MKTIIRLTTVVLFTLIAYCGKAQTVTICSGNSTTLNAPSVSNMTLTNISYSMNPGGIIGSGPSFVVSPATTTTYTLFVTGTTVTTVGSNTYVPVVLTLTNVATVQVVPFVPITANIGPLSQTVGCGPGVVVNATCAAISPSANVTHYWYTPGMPVPVASSGPNSSFTMTGIGSSAATFTCVIVDNVSGCKTSNTVQVIPNGNAYPTFASISSLMTANTFTLGCATRSLITDITVVGPSTQGGTGTSYYMLPPAYTGTNYVTGTAATYSVNIPGLYTFVIKDINNLCEVRVPISVVQNTVSPLISLTALTRTLSCANTSVTVTASSNVVATYYLWKRNSSGITSPGSTLLASTIPTGSVVDTYTLTGVDMINTCQTNTVFTIYQNVYKPNANIVCSGTSGMCQSSVNLTNVSTSGVPANTFFGNLGISTELWEGPAPTPSLANSSSYITSTAGNYTMTVKDLNNGCTNTGTFNVPVTMLIPTAAFTHTLTGGQATFNNTSINTDSNTAYYWDFGDGNYSIIQTPSHTYLNGGAHLVNLKITNAGFMCRDSVVQSVNVSGVTCLANSGFSMVPTATAQTWNVIPSYPWNISGVNWNWGDGSSSNVLYTSHQYATAGMYNICLTVTVSCSDTSTSCSPYNVYRTSQPTSVLKINVVAPELILGIGSSSISEQASWSLQPNPNAGEFNLRFTQPLSASTCVFIYDVTGRIVHTQTLEQNATGVSINTMNLQQGMYLVSLESEGLKTTRRMVVNR